MMAQIRRMKEAVKRKAHKFLLKAVLREQERHYCLNFLKLSNVTYFRWSPQDTQSEITKPKVIIAQYT